MPGNKHSSSSSAASKQHKVQPVPQSGAPSAQVVGTAAAAAAAVEASLVEEYKRNNSSSKKNGQQTSESYAVCCMMTQHITEQCENGSDKLAECKRAGDGSSGGCSNVTYADMLRIIAEQGRRDIVKQAANDIIYECCEKAAKLGMNVHTVYRDEPLANEVIEYLENVGKVTVKNVTGMLSTRYMYTIEYLPEETGKALDTE